MKKIIPLICVALLIACSKQEETPNSSSDTPVNAKPESHAEIAWFDGTVEQAFSAAKQQDKPLFFYWGAVWCPPCNELKATVFKRREFIEQTKLFIPVYLDGDTPGAQKYGEKFKVRGYPTLIVFDADANEITRIPGGLNLEKYADVLQLVFGEIKPVKQLVQLIDESKEAANSLTENDYRLLAYYSWEQDNQQVLPQESPAETLQKIFESCPNSLSVEKSRLFFAYLNAAMREFKDAKLALANAAFIETNLPVLKQILQDKALVLANVTAVRYEDGDTLRLLTAADSPEREALISQWRNALQVVARAADLSSVERLGALYGQVSLDKLSHDGKVTPELQQNIKSSITQARGNIENKYEHSAIVNISRNILVHADMQDYAEDVIADEIRNAASPYYFMLELADFAQQEGRKEEALSWFKQAYEESAKGATRFQWGVYYLGGLTEIVPEQEQRIKQQALELVEILANSEDGFYNRNTQRLKDMEGKLQKWNVEHEHDEAINEIRISLIQACKASGKLENEDNGVTAEKTSDCESYLL
ncbi:Thiol:disulfide interchange protein DsbD [Thalassocella blandensis]|nr:Thiol:disulfide interchange protein DsbD [Thalassocella blandensis]